MSNVDRVVGELREVREIEEGAIEEGPVGAFFEVIWTRDRECPVNIQGPYLRDKCREVAALE